MNEPLRAVAWRSGDLADIAERAVRRLDGGNCYMVGYHVTSAMIDAGLEPVLCHGIVGAGDNRHGHGWVEVDGWAVDFANGNAAVLPVGAYRRLGRVEAEEVDSYEPAEVRDHVLSTEHFGPWR